MICASLSPEWLDGLSSYSVYQSFNIICRSPVINNFRARWSPKYKMVSPLKTALMISIYGDCLRKWSCIVGIFRNITVRPFTALTENLDYIKTSVRMVSILTKMWNSTSQYRYIVVLMHCHDRLDITFRRVLSVFFHSFCCIFTVNIPRHFKFWNYVSTYTWIPQLGIISICLLRVVMVFVLAVLSVQNIFESTSYLERATLHKKNPVFHKNSDVAVWFPLYIENIIW
jgi:hypothetical protein